MNKCLMEWDDTVDTAYEEAGIFPTQTGQHVLCHCLQERRVQ